MRARCRLEDATKAELLHLLMLGHELNAFRRRELEAELKRMRVRALLDASEALVAAIKCSLSRSAGLSNDLWIAEALARRTLFSQHEAVMRTLQALQGTESAQ